MSPLPPGLDTYFSRIGYAGKGSRDFDTLQALQAHHIQAIPFENLTPFCGDEVSLDPEALIQKIIVGNRGGYCFELNSLFARALTDIGFEVRLAAARVLWNIPDHVRLPRTHMVLLVTCAHEEYLVDVAFGAQTPTAPLRLDTQDVQRTTHEPFRIAHEGDIFIVQTLIGADWKPLYAFDRQEQLPSDFEPVNWYVSRHPDSKFVKNLIAARIEPGKRHALLNNQYAVHHLGGETEKRVLNSREDILETLHTVFRIPTSGLPDFGEKLDLLLQA